LNQSLPGAAAVPRWKRRLPAADFTLPASTSSSPASLAVAAVFSAIAAGESFCNEDEDDVPLRF
jgi:hypothetical protein